MPKIKNTRYKQFLERGEISTLTELDLENLLNHTTGIRGRYTKEARALIICLYYTGARPVEILNIKGKHINKIKTYLVINIKGAKKGLTRPVYLSTSKPLIRELYNYSKKVFAELPLFFHYKNKYHRKTIGKNGKTKINIETTDRLRYFINKWGNNAGLNITPYFFRHNRFSKLSEKGATPEEIRQIKGSKTTSSVMPYLHLSSRTAKKLSRLID